jgi:Fanconi anemia group M protein
LPQVGPLIGKELLENFDSVKNVVNASADDLQEVDKVGKKKAKQIFDIVNRKYKQDF